MKFPRKARRLLEERGATVEQQHRGGHVKIHKPGHQPVFCGLSPSDRRAWKNATARLRREGYLNDDEELAP